jgi:hypothetical protein
MWGMEMLWRVNNYERNNQDWHHPILGKKYSNLLAGPNPPNQQWVNLPKRNPHHGHNEGYKGY